MKAARAQLFRELFWPTEQDSKIGAWVPCVAANEEFGLIGWALVFPLTLLVPSLSLSRREKDGR